MLFWLCGMKILSNKSPSHSRNHMLVDQAHRKKRDENVHVEGDGRFWEDATAWPRLLLLLRVRDMAVLNLLPPQAIT